MCTIAFGGLAIVAAAALAAPLALGLFPRIRLPAIVLGIVVGPQVLGWVSIDTPIQVMSLLGLAFLLLLASLEVEYERFRGRLLRLTALGYATRHSHHPVRSPATCAFRSTLFDRVAPPGLLPRWRRGRGEGRRASRDTARWRRRVADRRLPAGRPG